MSLRVLHVGKYFPPHRGGMETYLADLLQAQRSMGIEAAALVHGTPLPDDPAWLMRVPTYGQLLYAPLAPAFPFALAKAIERFEPDLLHLHLPNTSAFAALLLPAARELPWFIHWHSDVVASRIRGALALAYQAYRPLEQALLQRAECVIATSPPYLEASAALAAWRDKCRVVPLGIAPSCAAARTEPLAAELGWRPGVFRLLSIGRLAYYKSFETLIRAVAALSGVELLIIGDGERRAALQAEIDALTPSGETPKVRLLGSLDEALKNRLLAEADLFCLASCERTEAFGVVLLEAMQQGRPMLVSDLAGSGMAWVAERSGAGRLVKVGDVDAWREAIARARADHHWREQASMAGRQAFATDFALSHSAAAISRLYAQQLEFAAPAQARPLQPLIVIPARNEAETIGEVIASTRALGWRHVLVVDDGSTDDTAALARAAGAAVISPVLPQGAWGAMQTGIRYAVRHGYPGVVTMDADGQHEPEHIADLLAAAGGAERIDVVIGAFPERGSPLRRLAWRYFRLLTGLSLEDLTSGFRYYNRAACELLAGEEATLLDYQDVGVLLMLRRAGLRMCEVPVEMYPRRTGPSRIFASWRKVARYMLETSLLCIARWHVRRPF